MDYSVLISGSSVQTNSGNQTIIHSLVNSSQIASLGWNFSPVAPWAFAMAIIGAILLFWCFVPGFVNTIRTKDTSQMSFMMWTITFIGLALLVTFYAIGMAASVHTVGVHSTTNAVGGHGMWPSGNYTTVAKKTEVSSQFTVVFTCEALSLLMSTYVFLFKIFNMIKSKSLGITEAEYCEQLAKKDEEKRAAKMAAKWF